ncbi:hypothetical protein L204_103575 [Cryptococcus depauperatus]|nr:hypothetical protein L204_01889 [Cryptococcus depauperatus CBS 7855]
MPPRIPLSTFPPSINAVGPSRRYISSAPAKGKAVVSENNVIPPLPRPLGIPYPPTSAAKTWTQRKAEMLDDDRAKVKRKALLNEAKQGYFHDYNRARARDGGKLWLAPDVLIREDKANYFPNISAKSLLSTPLNTCDVFPSKTTLVTIISTRLSEEHVESMVRGVLEYAEGHFGFQHLTINHQPNMLKSLLISLSISSLKRTVPSNLWGSYLLASGSWSQIDVLEPLGLQNSLIGYVFLVDGNGKVRWAGCGEATGHEAEHLRRATAVLLGRMKSQRQVDASIECVDGPARSED